jgi:chemotaxis response regulator CheB
MYAAGHTEYDGQMSAHVHTESSGSPYGIVAIVASHGGLQVLRTITRALPRSLPTPIVIFQHLGRNRASQFAEIL